MLFGPFTITQDKNVDENGNGQAQLVFGQHPKTGAFLVEDAEGHFEYVDVRRCRVGAVYRDALEHIWWEQLKEAKPPADKPA